MTHRERLMMLRDREALDAKRVKLPHIRDEAAADRDALQWALDEIDRLTAERETREVAK